MTLACQLPVCQQAATSRAFALPPIQHDLAFVRLLLALGQLCHDVYLEGQHRLESTPHLDLPVQSRPGLAGERRMQIQLHYFR